MEMIGKDNKIGDLYMFNARNTNTYSFTPQSIVFVNNVLVHIWHSRLGHLSVKRLDTIKYKLNSNVSKLHSKSLCCICPLAKQMKISFVSYDNMLISFIVIYGDNIMRLLIHVIDFL